MIIESLDVFPLKMFKYQVQSGEALTQLKNEIEYKRPRMIEVSKNTNKDQIDYQSVETYVTDFKNPVELDNFEYIIHEMNQELLKHDLKFQKNQHWTALYRKGSFHLRHNHHLYSIDNHNYSGILYLSNEGSTTFYSPTVHSWQSKLIMDSSYGTIVLFPNTMLHDAHAHLENDLERQVVAFNGRLSFV